jgi:uncharacterized protein YhbP (UPF0306 family)
MTDEVTIARRLIETGRYMSLATSDGVRPWVAAVAYVCAAGPLFYWASRRDARHSLDLGASGQAAATIFDSQASYEDLEGVQLAGDSGVVPDDRVEGVFAVYVKRFPMYTAVRFAAFTNAGPFGLYWLRPSEVWTLAPASPEGDHRVPVDLSRLN